jgi:hypothetical protein
VQVGSRHGKRVGIHVQENIAEHRHAAFLVSDALATPEKPQKLFLTDGTLHDSRRLAV